MSLHQLANHMSARGRGPDSTLVHMSPREVEGLQKLAVANGTSLTINPDTGLPEAGALESMLPTLFGAAATYLTGGAITPFMAALGVGGVTALTSKDLGKGLMAGLGAYGGAGIVSGLAGFGTGSLSAEAGAAATQAAGAATSPLESEILSQAAIAPKLAGASYADKFGAGLSKAMSDPMGAASAIGGGSKIAGLTKVAGAISPLLAGETGNTVQTVTQRPRTGMIRPYRYDNMSQTFEEGTPYAAAKGGLMGLAHGGAVGYADGGIAEMYQSVLGRAPDAGGAAFWQQQFGDSVDANELAAFRQSALGGTDTADKTAAQSFGAPASTTGQGFAATAPVADAVPRKTGVDFGAVRSDTAPLAVAQAPVAQDFGATSNNTGAMASVGNNVMGTGASGSSIGQNAVVNKATQAATEMAAPVRDARADEAAFTAAGNAANNTGIAALPSESRLIAQLGPVESNNVVSQQQGPLITDQVYDLFKNVLDRPPSESDMKYWATQFGINNNTIDPNEIADFKLAAKKEIADRTADFDSSKNYIPISKLDDLYMQELSRHGEYGTGGKEGGMEFWKRTFGDYIDPQELAGFRAEAAKERDAREKATRPAVVTDLTTADTTYVKPGVGGSTGAGQIGGGTVINPNGTITTSPVIPGIPVGGFKGMEQVRNAYTTGGGSLGYTSYAPKTIDEFNTKYTNTGYQKEMYDYLMGRGDKPTKMKNADGTFREIMRPYKEATLGVPGSTNKRLTWNPLKGEYFRNPDYVRQQVITDPTTKEKSTINYMSINQAKDALKKTPLEGNALANWAIANFVDPATLAEATGMTINQINALLAKAKQDKDFSNKEGGLLSLANGGLATGGMPDKEFTDNTTGIKYYFDFKNGIYRTETTVKDGITYKWNPVTSKYEKSSASGTGIASLGGGDIGSPAGGENPTARPEGSYDISSNINPYTGSINALANGPVGTAVGKIAGLFGPQVSLNNAPVVDIAGTPTQAGKDYGKSSWGKTGDEGQDIGTVAPKGSTSITGSDALASITSDVAARAAAAGMTTAEFAEKGLAEVSARAQAESNDRPGGGGVAEGNYGEGLAGGYEKANGGMIGHYAQGGLGSLGGYSDGGRLLRGPGDGVSDSIPASIGNRQPARLADGEFVVPARIVSELGNGSTEAGARALYKMMARIQANRRKTTGKNSVAVDSKSHKYLPA